MDWIQVVVLALIQGLTEFLPISSSGHLVLVPRFLNWTDQGLAFDVAVHLGTLLAVLLYFKKDVTEMATAGLGRLSGKPSSPASKLLVWVTIATIPAGLAGLFFGSLIEEHLRSPLVIALTTIGFGVLLWLSDVFKKETRVERDLTIKDAILIGLAQAIAIIPGTSRSGITMTMGLALGLGRTAAARISFLMAIPAIMLASGWQTVKLIKTPDSVDWSMLGLGIIVSAVAAYLCIRWFLSWIDRCGFLPFAIYRLILGVVIFVVLV